MKTRLAEFVVSWKSLPLLDDNMVGFSTSSRFIEHVTGPDHPERPDRIRAICRAVREAGLVQSADPFPDFEIEFGDLRSDQNPLPRLVELTPAPAGESTLLLVHPRHHIDRVKSFCAASWNLDPDTPVQPSSFDIALLAVGSAITAADAVMNGTVRRAFSAARPPGHHAEPDKATGFCLFSNAAIVARHIQRAFNLRRVAIVDFDVHHGNGTQACLLDDPSILFISMHQDPRTCYPGTGFASETGVGAGEGYTINLPFPAGSTDADYLKVLDQRVLPALDSFGPEVLLLSAGFDAHCADPLAQMDLTEEGFARITSLLCQAADRHCGGRVVSLLEGGYNLRALGRSVVAHLLAMT